MCYILGREENSDFRRENLKFGRLEDLDMDGGDNR